MKLLVSMFICFLGFSAQAVTLKDLAGTYKVTAVEKTLKVEDDVTLTEDGHITLTETSVLGTIKCEGKAKILKTDLYSDMTCEDGSHYEQEVELAGVDVTSGKFVAQVYSSLFDMKVPMNFEKQ